jgi:hypothetical protein
MASFDRIWKHRFRKNVPFRKLIDRLVVRPMSLIAGHLGYGTDITIYAVKQQDGGSTPPPRTVENALQSSSSQKSFFLESADVAIGSREIKLLDRFPLLCSYCERV